MDNVIAFSKGWMNSELIPQSYKKGQKLNIKLKTPENYSLIFFLKTIKS